MVRASHITPSAKQLEYYADIADDFTRHPLTGDVVRTTNEDAVARSIRHILLTNRGDWPFRPDLGSDIRKSLFQPFGPFLVEDLQTAIREAIKKYEPRATVVGLDIYDAQADGAVGINLLFTIINDKTTYRLDTILTRGR
jgi:phage baseplate assembly protein W